MAQGRRMQTMTGQQLRACTRGVPLAVNGKLAFCGPRRPSLPISVQGGTWCLAAAAGAELMLGSPPNTTSALSTYRLPRPAQQLFSSTTRVWFEAMVQTVVRQLDGATPFLLKVNLQPMLQLSMVRLSSSDMQHGWQHIQQQHIAAEQPYDAVIFVHPVSAGQQPCAVSQVQGDPCPGCPHTAPASSSVYSSEAEMLQGKFGDCCSGEEHTAASHHHQPQPSPACASQLSYYGLVVQCRDPAESLQGCYLLKTMQVKQHSGGGSGCHCTHYSLNRVCQGPSLQQQFQAAWLV
eukprot:gene8494-biopygen10350